MGRGKGRVHHSGKCPRIRSIGREGGEGTTPPKQREGAMHLVTGRGRDQVLDRGGGGEASLYHEIQVCKRGKRKTLFSPKRPAP